MNVSPAPCPVEAISASLRMILAGILAKLGMWGLAPQLGVLTFRRISFSLRRIAWMLERFRAGKLVQVAPRARSPGQRIVNKPAVKFSRKFGWLLEAGKHEAALYAWQLQSVLAMPEMAEMLEAVPQARRVLRPVLRALAVELPWVIDTPSKPRLRKPRPMPEPDRSPLPRGVKTWIRKQKRLEKMIAARDALVLQMAQKPVF